MWVTNGGNNDTGYSDPRYDELIRKAAQSSTTEERFGLFQEAERMLMDAAPIIPIYFYTRITLTHPSVKNWHPTILDHHPYKYVYLEEAK
jgi:oligopeptide transport system substrate-binding protein